MAKARYVTAFEHFKNKTNPDNSLEAMVAFGLFIDGERKWDDGKTTPPTDGDYLRYYDASLTPDHTDFYLKSARDVLLKVSNDLLAKEQPRFMAQALTEYKNEAKRGHRGFRLWGVVEAAGGALLWTIILIVGSIVLAWNGIDALEYLKKAYPIQHSN